MNTQEMQDAATQLDAADQGANLEPVEQGAAQEKQPAAQQAQEPTFDAVKFQEEYRQEMNRIKADLNRANSELGQFRKQQSESAKAAPQTQVPKSWQDLDEQTRKATQEMVMHIVREQMGDKFKTIEELAAERETRKIETHVLGTASSILGADFEKMNKDLGDVYAAVKGLANQGDQEAQEFLQEIHTTKSGVHRLVDIAKAKVSQSMQAQSEKAKLEQEAKAKRVSTVTGGGKPVAVGVGKDGLPTDKAERMKAIAAKLDEAYAE